MSGTMRQPAYDDPFRTLTADEEAWLEVWFHEGAKELTVEALQLCMDLIAPAAGQSPAQHTEEEDRRALLRNWFGCCYPSTFKHAMDDNVRIALEIHGRWRAGARVGLRSVAEEFFRAARSQYESLTAHGMPNGLRPWLRFLE